MNISIQNSDENIRLLIAQRHLYTKAKKLHQWNIVTIILALISPFILFFMPDLKLLMGIIGGTCVIITHILKGTESKIIKDAATVQEQFDTGLFELPWNKTLVGNRLTPELIYEADRDFKGDKRKLKDWYPDTDKIRYPLNVLLCQRSNLVWDWRLHIQYGVMVTIVTVGWSIVIIIFAIITKQTPTDFLLGLLLPSLSALIQGIETARIHLKISKEKENKEKWLSNILESGLNDSSSITKELCREVQDYIYNNRKEPFIPDWWYDIYRNKYENDMQSVISEFRKKVDDT